MSYSNQTSCLVKKEKVIFVKKALFLFFTIFLVFSIFLTGCGKSPTTQEENNKLTVYTTVYPLQYFTEKIGGDYVKVETIYPPGADEHTFDPSQKDMIKLVDADLFFYIGLGLEGFVDKAKKTSKNGNVEMIATAEQISLELEEEEKALIEEEEHESHDESHDGHDHSIDPHVWLDPIYAQEIAASIKDALIKKVPENKGLFEQNYQEIVEELETLDQSFKNTIQTAKHKEIIVSHAAYGYWEKRYGLEQISVSGLSTTNEPSQKKLEQIISIAEQHNIKYIFFEQNVTSKLTEIIQKEVGAKPLILHNLAVLTTKDIENKETYFTIMDKNIKALKKALTN